MWWNVGRFDNGIDQERRNHGVYGQDNAYNMFINIKVERPNYN